MLNKYCLQKNKASYIKIIKDIGSPLKYTNLIKLKCWLNKPRADSLTPQFASLTLSVYNNKGTFCFRIKHFVLYYIQKTHTILTCFLSTRAFQH